MRFLSVLKLFHIPEILCTDIFEIKGYVSWIGDPAKRDATIISILYEAGAVPFVKTNLPQTLMVRRIAAIHKYVLIADLFVHSVARNLQ